jgi:hypothetical protein
MLSVCETGAAGPLHPAMPAATHAMSRSPAQAYPRRFARGRRFKLKTYTSISAQSTIQIGSVRKGGTCGGAVGGVKNESAVVVSVAVQKAVAAPAPAVGVQVAGAERVVVPLLNCTVPVGPAPLLVVVTVAVNFTLSPALMLEAELVTVVVVASPVIVKATGAEALALKLASPL